MKKILSVVLIVFGGLAAGCGSQGNVRLDEGRISEGWKENIVSSSRPATILFQERSVYGGVQPPKATAPEAGQQWVVVRAEITPPKVANPTAGSPFVLAKEIQLIEPSGTSYALRSMDTATAQPSTFATLAGNSLGKMDKNGGLLWVTQENGSIIVFVKQEPITVDLLFAVATAARTYGCDCSR